MEVGRLSVSERAEHTAKKVRGQKTSREAVPRLHTNSHRPSLTVVKRGEKSALRSLALLFLVLRPLRFPRCFFCSPQLLTSPLTQHPVCLSYFVLRLHSTMRTEKEDRDVATDRHEKSGKTRG
jgi:hypothetical protein